jgi:hypothetical protein
LYINGDESFPFGLPLTNATSAITTGQRVYGLTETPLSSISYLKFQQLFGPEATMPLYHGLTANNAPVYAYVDALWNNLTGTPFQTNVYNSELFGAGDLELVQNCAVEYEIDFEFVIGNVLNMEIPECDLLFIDTLHNYNQLKQELSLHSNKVKKYIIFHDTVSFAYSDEKNADEMGMLNQIETNLPKGLWPAIEEFLYHNRDWVIWEKKPNNNGLTILKRLY